MNFIQHQDYAGKTTAFTGFYYRRHTFKKPGGDGPHDS